MQQIILEMLFKIRTFNSNLIFQVVLKGVAVLDDSRIVAKRKDIERNLESKEKRGAVKWIVEELIKGIQRPARYGLR